MRLTPNEISKYENKFKNLDSKINPIIHQNGVFEIDEVLVPELFTTLVTSDFIDTLDKHGDGVIGKVKSLEEDVEIHDTLNPKLWDENEELLPEVKTKILEIVDLFKQQLKEDNIDLKIKDIYILGSNANYNYNDDSDLDVHIIADESDDCLQKHLPTIYNAYKSLFNSKYDISFKGINVEIYVENADKLTNVATGVYSLNNGWIKKPAKANIPEIDQTQLEKDVNIWEQKYFTLIQKPSIESIDNYVDDIYKLRNDSIQKEGEFGLGNLVFKEIRRLGYLDELKEMRKNLVEKELSIEENK